MLSVSGVSLKEAIELIESRIPGGRKVTTVVLSLLVIVVVILCFRFIKDAAVIPLFDWISATTSVIRTRNFAPDLYPLLQPLIASLISAGITYFALYSVFKMVIRTIGRLAEAQSRHLNSVSKTVTSLWEHAKLLEVKQKQTDGIVESVVNRLTVLEERFRQAGS